MSASTSAAAPFSGEGLSNASPIDRTSRQGRKSTLRAPRGRRQRRGTKPPKLALAAVTPVRSQLPDSEIFRPPGGTYSVPDVCAHPPPILLHVT